MCNKPDHLSVSLHLHSIDESMFYDFNCYKTRDGSQKYQGAEDFEHPPDTSARFMSIEDCKKLYNKTDQCTELNGVTIKKREGDKHDCYRKSTVKLHKCDEAALEPFELKV